jgi:hypothetical protein
MYMFDLQINSHLGHFEDVKFPCTNLQIMAF